mgnify:FL=1
MSVRFGLTCEGRVPNSRLVVIRGMPFRAI